MVIYPNDISAGLSPLASRQVLALRAAWHIIGTEGKRMPALKQLSTWDTDSESTGLNGRERDEEGDSVKKRKESDPKKSEEPRSEIRFFSMHHGW
jgi:hypothetical protein